MKEELINIDYRGSTVKILCGLNDKSTDEWVVCFHGLQSCKNIFDPLLSRSFFQSYSTLAIDFVGFGGSSKPLDFSYDLQDQANICALLIKHIGIKKMHMIGHSMGGMVGTLLLKPLSDSIVSFINVEGNLILDHCGLSLEVLQYSFDEFRSAGYEHIKSTLRSTDAHGSVKRSLWTDLITDFAFYKSSASILAWAKSEKLLSAFLESTQRKLYVYGEDCVSKVSRFSDVVDCAEISHSGHFMMFDNPEGYATCIEEFLAKN